MVSKLGVRLSVQTRGPVSQLGISGELGGGIGSPAMIGTQMEAWLVCVDGRKNCIQRIKHSWRVQAGMESKYIHVR